ncbi:MAG: hypothetical protein ACEPOZ_16995 [Marinifilaceae bacterium]
MQTIYSELLAIYNDGISKQDPATIRNFLNDRKVDELKSSPDHYLHILQLRASAFTLFGELENADREYLEGSDYCPEVYKWEYMLKWAQMYLAELSLNREDQLRKNSFSVAISILDKALDVIPESKEKRFHQLTLWNLKAFFLLCNNEKEAAKACYKDCAFEPVPIPAYNDKNALVHLFSNYFKGLAVAIELKDVRLLMNLLRVISIDDRILMEEENLFKLFYDTLLNTFDLRSEFSAEFNALYRQKDNFGNICPGFARFMDLIGAQKFGELNVFFDLFYQ